MTAGKGEGTPLEIHTLDSLCDELVSGRSVYLGDGTEISFGSLDTRTIFCWYVENRKKWTGHNRKEDVEDIVNRLGRHVPKKPVVVRPAGARGNRCLHLRSIRAHRFGGIHKYGHVNQPPKDFEYTFEKAITLVEGMNGSGKTSLLNAIVWCLTGYIYRSQRGPEEIEGEIEIRTPSLAGTESLCKTCTPITPIPNEATLNALGDDTVLLDTWVELTFEDDDGNQVGKVRRSQTRTARGKVTVQPTGFDSLGLDPIALHVGTRMSGLIPYIQLEEVSDVGQAIAALTPFRALSDLVNHARKSKDGLPPRKCASRG
jgi:hypothetical protein